MPKKGKRLEDTLRTWSGGGFLFWSELIKDWNPNREIEARSLGYTLDIFNLKRPKILELNR